jgi:UDP-N-acetylmuramate dehydrogenase
LVLVNHGGANQAELLDFAHKIQAQVLQHYGLTINIEPIVVR